MNKISTAYVNWILIVIVSVLVIFTVVKEVKSLI